MASVSQELYISNIWHLPLSKSPEIGCLIANQRNKYAGLCLNICPNLTFFFFLFFFQFHLFHEHQPLKLTSWDPSFPELGKLVGSLLQNHTSLNENNEGGHSAWQLGRKTPILSLNTKMMKTFIMKHIFHYCIVECKQVLMTYGAMCFLKEVLCMSEAAYVPCDTATTMVSICYCLVNRCIKSPCKQMS